MYVGRYNWWVEPERLETNRATERAPAWVISIPPGQTRKFERPQSRPGAGPSPPAVYAKMSQFERAGFKTCTWAAPSPRKTRQFEKYERATPWQLAQKAKPLGKRSPQASHPAGPVAQSHSARATHRHRLRPADASPNPPTRAARTSHTLPSPSRPPGRHTAGESNTRHPSPPPLAGRSDPRAAPKGHRGCQTARSATRPGLHVVRRGLRWSDPYRRENRSSTTEWSWAGNSEGRPG